MLMLLLNANGHRTPWLSPSGRRGANQLSEETNLKLNAAVKVGDDKIVESSLNRTPRVKPPSSKPLTTKRLKMAPMILDRMLKFYGNYRMLLIIS